MLDRRSFLAGLSAAAALPARAAVSLVRDSAGRMVPIPETVARMFPAGPPAAMVVYTLAPEALLGWPRANRAGGARISRCPPSATVPSSVG